MPSASVRTTVMARPLARASDRKAKPRSVIQLMMLVPGPAMGPRSPSGNSRSAAGVFDRAAPGFRYLPIRPYLDEKRKRDEAGLKACTTNYIVPTLQIR